MPDNILKKKKEAYDVGNIITHEETEANRNYIICPTSCGSEQWSWGVNLGSLAPELPFKQYAPSLPTHKC